MQGPETVYHIETVCIYDIRDISHARPASSSFTNDMRKSEKVRILYGIQSRVKMRLEKILPLEICFWCIISRMHMIIWSGNEHSVSSTRHSSIGKSAPMFSSTSVCTDVIIDMSAERLLTLFHSRRYNTPKKPPFPGLDANARARFWYMFT